MNQSSSVSVGYLFNDKDQGQKDQDELLPLDFTPTSTVYPKDWKDIFGTKGFLTTTYVLSDFARLENELFRRLRRIGKSESAKDNGLV